MNTEKILTIFRLYFLEIIFLTLGTVFAIFVLDETEGESYTVYLSLFLVYFISIFLANGSRFYRHTAFLPILGSILLYFDLFSSEKIFILNCIAVLSLFGKNWLKDNHLFIQQAFKILFHIVLSGLLIVISFGVISLILVSIQALFGLNGEKIYFYLWTSAFFWFAPFVFLYFQYHERNRTVHLNYLGNLLFNYILSPALIIYTAVLYFYFATLLFKVELPKNIISFIVLPYLIGGFIIQFFQMLLRQNKWGKFYCHFHQLALLPIIMMWVAVYERVANYGLTDARIYYIFCAGAMSLCYLLLWWKKTQYRWFLAIIISGLFISTFIINVEKLAIDSQLNRAKVLLSQNHLLDEQGKIKSNFQKNIKQISNKDKQNLESALHYIHYNDYKNNILETEFGIKEYGEFSLFESHEQSYYFYYDNKEIDVSGYQKIIFNPIDEQYEKIEIWAKEDLKTIFEQNGLDFYQLYSQEDLENKIKQGLSNYKKDGHFYIINRLHLSFNPETGYDVSYVYIQAILY